MPTLLDRYQLLRPLGRGGSASAWLALDLLHHSTLALKLLHAPSPLLLSALHLEFELLRSLHHPRLVRVHDFAPLPQPATSAASCLFTADFVPGVTLDLAARGSPWPTLRLALVDLLEALRCLHSRSIRHGDVKPANVIVGDDGRATLLDLGCARPVPAPPADAVCGTPGFIAPELLAHGTADHRADLFAFGVTLRLLLQDRVDVPQPVLRILPRLLDPDPDGRPADADEVLESFDVEPAALPRMLAHPGVLVGRDHVLREARGCLDAFRQGRPGARVVQIVGVDGVGRTRALRELVWEAQRSLRVVEVDTSTPGAIGTALSTAIGSPIEVRHAGDAAAGLERLRAAAAPVVLAIDDLHRAHDAQRQLVLALCRSLLAGDPLLVLVGTDTTLDPDDSVQVRLEPLTESDVASWVGLTLSRETARALHRASGGFPSSLVVLLRQMEAGRLDESAIVSGRAQVCLDDRRAGELRGMGRDEQSALAWLASCERTASQRDLDRLGLARAAMDALVSAGLACRDGVTWRLARSAEASSLQRMLPQAIVRETHRALAEAALADGQAASTAPAERSELLARAAYHLARSGQVDAALGHLLHHSDERLLAPSAWLRAAEALAACCNDPRAALARASLLRAHGQARAAVAALESLLASRPGPDLDMAVRYELAASLLDAGDVDRAVVELDAMLVATPVAPWAARCSLLLARTLARRGDYRGAAERAEHALAHAHDDAARADALISSGVAQSFLGRTAEAWSRLEQARELVAKAGDARLVVRAHGSRGLVAFHAGKLDEARAAYAAALSEADTHALADQMATAALNLGTACHQAGQWAEAWDAYERGMRIAVALGQPSTEALLRFNLVKLHVDIGQFDRAEALLDRSESVARRAGTQLAVAELLAVRAELAQWRGELDQARDLLQQAGQAFDQHQSVREKAEVDIQLAEVCAAAGVHDAAQHHLAAAQEAFGSDMPPDVRIRLELARAVVLMGCRDPSRALAATEPAIRLAGAAGLPDLQARGHVLLAQIWDTQGSALLASRHRTEARVLWERMAALLPDSVRAAFWRHPVRRDTHPVSAVTPTPTSAARDSRFERLLDINKRILSSLDTTEVLRRAMDAAIELTGAERGFVLLAESRDRAGKFRVAAARNLDREHVDRAQLKFSRAIAEQVVASASPVTTDEARADSRFATAASVHALQLASVACVPVIAPSGVIGALYLDHRFQRGRFSAEDVRVLQAFADQVALALTNARLHRELAERTRELEDRNRRVEELTRSQAAQIEALQEQVRASAPTPVHRYDYASIVGSSHVMRQLFSVLDRVIDTDLPILISGESGTGKELVARAIHTNSPRCKGPIVAINCGAVPEQLLESELFGYERGAFTGADRSREGLMVRASGGTLFLDELGELPLAMQVKLLRVLQEREVRPLGTHRAVPVDFRLVCATNRRLRDEMARGTFREDLFYRVSAIELTLPPLRDRLEDVPALATRLLERAARDTSRPVPQLTRSALQRLMSAPWPGNVRQLENVLLKAMVLCDGGRIASKDIDLPSTRSVSTPALSRSAYEAMERERIERALVEHRWNVARVSRALAIPRPTLYRKLAKFGLTSPPKSSGEE